MKIKAVTAGDAAFILRLKLGPLRAWDDALADMRRERTTHLGHVLLPYCVQESKRGRRPLYKVTDIRNFIERVEGAVVGSPGVSKYNIYEIEHDPADRRSWNLRVIGMSA